MKEASGETEAMGALGAGGGGRGSAIVDKSFRDGKVVEIFCEREVVRMSESHTACGLCNVVRKNGLSTAMLVAQVV